MNIVICGTGRAGKELAKKIILDKEHKLVAVVCRNGSDYARKDIGDVLNMPKQDCEIVEIQDCKRVLIKNIDVMIDFSYRTMSIEVAQICNELAVKSVICTTGFSQKEELIFKELAMKPNSGILYAPNLTIGVNLLIEFVKKISKLLPDYDFEIIERHRRDKPRVTTTAKIIAKAIDRENINISSIRVGGYVGLHEVTAANENERLTIIHESFSRNAFATSALVAADFIKSRCGYYVMQDIIEKMENNI